MFYIKICMYIDIILYIAASVILILGILVVCLFGLILLTDCYYAYKKRIEGIDDDEEM